MSTQFKIGDRVEVHGMSGSYSNYNGIRGTVKSIDHRELSIEPAEDSSFSQHKRLYFKNENLRLIESHVTASQPAAFKVGDRVRVIKNCGPESYNRTVGMTGTIFGGPVMGPFNLKVELEDGVRSILFKAEELELLSPSSPQPQQNQTPKEEDNMKPYAVIYHNLSGGTQASLQSYHTTEAEAKEAAEGVVAGQRANLTTKNYFTVTIVNTKTGELVGSVSDAPPAVDWKAGK